MISLWHGLQQGPVRTAFEQVVENWNRSHQDKQIALKAYDNYGAPGIEALALPQEERPSLVLAPEFLTGKMLTAYGEKQVIPIGELLSPERLSMVAEIVRRTFGDPQGNLLSLPLNPACGVLFTNQDLLVKSGRAADFIPKTIEELEEVCADLIAKGIVPHGYTTAWPAAYLVEVPAAQQNLPLALPDNGKLGYGTYQMSSPWLKEHLLELRKEQKKGIYLYSGQTNDAKIPFINREVAFFMQGSTHMPILEGDVAKTSAPFTIGVGPLPTLVKGQNEKYAFPLGGGALWVLDSKKTREMIRNVRDFLDFLAGDEAQKQWHCATAYVPVSTSLPETLATFYKQHPLHAAVVAQTIESKLGDYSFGVQMPNYADARKALFALIEQIVSPETKEEQIPALLTEFDTKFSIGKQ